MPIFYVLLLAVPEKASQLVESGLKRMSFGDRLSVAGAARRELMWIIEELLFHKMSSAAALRCLALLAEAETEDCRNNATGVFGECFQPLHPQFPLPLSERLDTLKGIFSSQNPVGLRLIGIKGIEKGLSGREFVSLRHSNGPVPFDARPPMTYSDIWDYVEDMVDLLMELARSPEPKLAKSACALLPGSIAKSAIQALPKAKAAIEKFQIVVNWTIIDKLPIPVAGLYRSLKFACDEFTKHSKCAKEETKEIFHGCIKKIGSLVERIDEGDFSIRFRKWVGSQSYLHDEDDEDENELNQEGKRISRFQKELEIITEEAINIPDVLSDDLLEWLCSEEARRTSLFCWRLGEKDTERKWLSKMEEMGTDKNGIIVFSSYFGGLIKQDRSFVSKRLDELVKGGSIHAEAIVRTTAYLGGDLVNVQRIEKLIQAGRIEPMFISHELRGRGWLEALSQEEFLYLLKAIAGPELKNAMAAIELLGMWIHYQKPIEGQFAEFAWQCLESGPHVKGQESYTCEYLASVLAQAVPDRGFRLLENLLPRFIDEGIWLPIGYHKKNKFWEVLYKANRERALLIFLQQAIGDPEEMIDQEADADILIALALENETQAKLISKNITGGQPGFWPIVFKIIEKYPNNLRIRNILSNSVRQINRIISGPLSLHYESCRKDVESVLKAPATPSVARPWLQELESSLHAEAEHELIVEIDEEVNDLRHIIEDPSSPERLWAIGTLLRLGQAEKLRKFLSEDELLPILQNLHAPKNHNGGI